MSGVNKVILVGHLGRDPEIKYTQANVPVANFSLATSESWKDKTTGEWEEKTEWHRVVAWRALAERCQAKLKKGSQVYIEGRLATRTWEKDGQKHYSAEVVADKMLPLGTKDDEPAAPRKPFTQPPAPPAEDDDLPF